MSSTAGKWPVNITKTPKSLYLLFSCIYLNIQEALSCFQMFWIFTEEYKNQIVLFQKYILILVSYNISWFVMKKEKENK